MSVLDLVTETASRFRTATPTLDFGNFAVGFATLTLAAVTVVIALRSGRRESKRIIAEFRRDWLEDLRRSLADHIGLSHKLVGTIRAKRTEVNDLYSEIFRSEQYIRLKLNPAESAHSDLMKTIVNMRFCQNRMRTNEDAEQLRKEMDLYGDLRSSFTNLSSRIMKDEWDRLKYEIHGGWISAIVRMFTTEKKRTQWARISPNSE